MVEILGFFFLKLLTYGAPLLAIYLLYKIFRDRKKADEVMEEDYVIISIMVPKQNEKTPLAAEQMFAALHGILNPSAEHQYHLSMEIASQDKFTQFYVRVPVALKDFVEGQIYAQYPTVEIDEVPDYTDIDIENVAVAGTELTLTKKDVYPIKTFLNFEVDPLAGITGILSKVQGAERLWVQILVRPVDDDWQDRGVALVKAIRDGFSFDFNWGTEILKHVLAILFEIPKTLISPPKADKEKKKEEKKEKEEKKLPGPQEAALTGIETKIQKLGFETKIRVLAVAGDEATAKSKLMAAVGAFKQFNTTNLNGFLAGNVATGKDLLTIFQLRPFGADGYVFNIEELASIYHFPHVSVETPSIVWAGSKKGEPPANLPVEGMVASDDLTVFGVTNFRHMNQKFGLKKKDRRLHTYLIGKTGTGKSTLLQNMIVDDIREGRGLAIVDPHGDTIKYILDYIPEGRVNDVIYFNPADNDYPIGFNLLENVDPDLKNIVASGLMSVFTKLWANVWSARMEYILRNAILALLEYPNATFLEIMRLLNDKKFRTKVLEHVKDPVIRDFFINEYEKYDPKFRNEAIAPIQNKVGQFLSSTTIRNIVGQKHSTIDLSDIMDSGKILLIDLTTGKIGEDNSALLGAMMITKIQLAAMRRVDRPEDQRRDFYLYVDEFQNFATESFAVILSEARKYHLCLIMANQYIAQLSEEVSDAIFGNVGTMISFRVGSADAEKLVKEYEPVFDANDLVNLDNYHIYTKMAIDGVTCPAFSAQTLPPQTEVYGFRDTVIELSRRKYGRPKDEVEDEIARSAASLGEPTGFGGESEVKENAPVKIDSSIYKEASAKGGGKWYFYEGEEENKANEDKDKTEKNDRDNKEPVQENKDQLQLDEVEIIKDNPLIMTHEAHEIARGSFRPGENKKHFPNVEMIPLKEGETIELKR